MYRYNYPTGLVTAESTLLCIRPCLSVCPVTSPRDTATPAGYTGNYSSARADGVGLSDLILITGEEESSVLIF